MPKMPKKKKPLPTNLIFCAECPTTRWEDSVLVGNEVFIAGTEAVALAAGWEALEHGYRCPACVAGGRALATEAAHGATAKTAVEGAAGNLMEAALDAATLAAVLELGATIAAEADPHAVLGLVVRALVAAAFRKDKEPC